MKITLSGMVMLLRLAQPEKASFSIVVTLSGMVMLVMLQQLQRRLLTLMQLIWMHS